MVSFRFYGPLNDFLPAVRRFGRVMRHLRAPASVKDAIEAIGVPHPEVDVIIVNGEPTDFSCTLRDGDSVAVYPRFRSIDVTGFRRAGSDPPDPVRFVADIHLRKLASLLRLAGFDVPLLEDDAHIGALSAAERRVALTRDVGVLKRSIIQFGCWVRNTDPELQLVEVLERFDLADRMQPFVRCMECNTGLVSVDADVVADQLPPGTRECFSEFHRCPGCQRIYWQGSHYDRLVERLERVRRRVRGS